MSLSSRELHSFKTSLTFASLQVSRTETLTAIMTNHQFCFNWSKENEIPYLSLKILTIREVEDLTWIPYLSLMEPRRMQDTAMQDRPSSNGMQKHQPKSPAVWHCMQGKHQ